MIIVKIWGGIGNQLFQYVFGQYLHLQYHQEVCYDDNSFLSTDKLRKRELDSIDSNILWDNHCSFSKFRGLKGRLLRYLYELNPRHHFVGPNDFIPKKYKSTDEYFFQGYWQNHKYYEWLMKNIPGFRIESKEFPQQLSDIKKQILTCPQSISIHVRRGDYFLPKFVSVYGVCTEKYFQDAMVEMKSKVSNGRLFVFTDDVDWTTSHLQFGEDDVIVPNYEISQFAYIELMSLCTHHIISNSSFSWWGAVINEKPDSIVICPAKWTLTSDETIALDKWIKI